MKNICFLLTMVLIRSHGVVLAQQIDTGAVSDITASTDVPIEEYVLRVIIEGKWGSGPGEFGMASRFPLGLYDQYTPSSLAVDSKGNVYVLDFVNNRIQKFEKGGKYLTSLPVEGLKGELSGYCAGDTCYEVPPAPGVKYDRPVIGGIETIGINIVIDSKDTLYYYLKRVKDGKETGEVWEFKGDKVVKKTEVPVTNSLSAGVGLELNKEDDSLFVPNINKKTRGTHYDVRRKQVVKTKDVNEMRNKFRATEEGRQAALKPKPKHYLDIEVFDGGIKVVRKLN